MRLRIHHHTLYRYDTPPCSSIQYLRLTPRNDATQQVLNWNVRASGSLDEWQDGFGNVVHTLVCKERRDALVIEAMGELETNDRVHHLDGRDEALRREVYLRHTPLTASDNAIKAFVAPFRPGLADAALDTLLELMFAIRARVDFRNGSTHVFTSAAEAFASSAGVCQDHAHIFIACCRELGIPARYVGGYLLLDTGSANQTAGHAWSEAWIAGMGWVSFDVANTRHSHTTHVRVAIGLDYRDASPVVGVRTGGGPERMEVTVQVVQTQQ